MTEFHWIEKIYVIVRKIPRGKVATFGDIADAVGNRTTSRMVGWAMNKSFLAKPKVPAHRVVNRNGVLTGKVHFGTPTLMQELLEAEGVKIQNDTVVDFNKRRWKPNVTN
ncbi:MAG: MGMT family protein [Chitinophagaceae bacterium]